MPGGEPVSSRGEGAPAWVLGTVVLVALVLVVLAVVFLAEFVFESSTPNDAVTAPPTSGAAVTASPTSGAMTIDTDMTLLANHNGRIIIAANNVSLDCAGYTIFGEGEQTSPPGISISDRSGVTVKNCNLANFNDGFRVTNSQNNTFIDNTVSQVRQGFTFHNADGNILSGNMVIDASDWFGYGLFDGSDRNQISGNTATGVTGVGFMIGGGTGNTFDRNNSSDNSGNGFGANPPATGNIYTANIANNNTQNGFEDQTTGGRGDFGTDNTYVDNVCTGNAGSRPGGVCSRA